MDYKIVEKPAFKVVGKSIRVATKDGNNLVVIPEFWQQSSQDGTVLKLASMASTNGVVGDAILGICKDFSDNMEEFTYMIAAELHEAPGGMVAQKIPAATWAVFEATGPLPEAIQNVWGVIWLEFFQTTPYLHGAAPDLEIYPCEDPNGPNYQFQVWVPVVAK